MPRHVTPKLSIAAREFQTYRGNAGNGSKGEMYTYRSLLGRLVAHLGDVHVGSVKPSHLEDFFYGVNGLANSCASTTLGNYRGRLKSFFDWCHRREYTSHTGLYLLGGIADKSTRANRDRFRMDRRQLLRLMDAATDPRDRALIAFVANTGVRIGEALSLRVRDLRLDRSEVYVTRHKTRQEVTYPATSDLEAELRAWLAAYAAELAKSGQSLSPGHYLFPAKPVAHYQKGAHRNACSDGYNPAGRINNPRTIILPIAERAGLELEKGDGWHTVRRSVARIFFDDAADDGHDRALRLTQALLGHKHSQTTEGYLGLDPERLAVDKMLRGKSFITKGVNDGNVVNLDDRRAN